MLFPDRYSERQGKLTPYYEENGITIYHGDCREVLPSLFLEGTTVVTDPPYNCGKNYGATTNDRMEWAEWCAWWDGCLEVFAWSSDNIFAFLSQTAYRKYCRHGRHEVDWSLIWFKPLSLAVTAMPFMPHYENIAYWGRTLKRDLPKRSDVAGWGSDVLEHNVCQRKFDHPTPKPLPLLLDLVGRFDTTILDPFAGSGTTLRAALELGQQAIGIEINETYCEVIAKRLSAIRVGLKDSPQQMFDMTA